jgi:hypothetical protein
MGTQRIRHTRLKSGAAGPSPGIELGSGTVAGSGNSVSLGAGSSAQDERTDGTLKAALQEVAASEPDLAD